MDLDSTPRVGIDMRTAKTKVKTEKEKQHTDIFTGYRIIHIIPTLLSNH